MVRGEGEREREREECLGVELQFVLRWNPSHYEQRATPRLEPTHRKRMRKSFRH